MKANKLNNLTPLEKLETCLMGKKILTDEIVSHKKRYKSDKVSKLEREILIRRSKYLLLEVEAVNKEIARILQSVSEDDVSEVEKLTKSIAKFSDKYPMKRVVVPTNW